MMQSNWNKEILDYLKAQAPVAFDNKEFKSELVKNLSRTHINIALPASFCQNCKTKIAWWQNIPLVSYVILAGKCKNCTQKISMVYPSVELISGVLMAILATKFFHLGIFTFIALTIFVFSLLIISFIDLKHFLIPDTIVLPIIWLALIWHFIFHNNEFDQFFYGAIFGYLSLWILKGIFLLLLKKDAIGNGDFKLFAAIGAFLGWQSLVPIVFVASSLGILAFIITAIVGSNQKIAFDYSSKLPFAPFLSIGAIVFILTPLPSLFEFWFFTNDWFNFLLY